MARYVKSGTVNTVQEINSELEKIATAQDEFVTRNGEAPNEMKATLDMNSNRITNLPAPNSPNEPLRFVDAIGGVSFTVSTDEALVFDNIAEMKLADLSIGQSVRCNRYYNGGELVDGLLYEIQETQSSDGYVDHALNNGNVAKLIISENLSVVKAGAVADFDTATKTGTNNFSVLQACIDFVSNAPDIGSAYIYEPAITIYIPEGDYGLQTTGTQRLLVNSNNVRIIGAGMFNTNLYHFGTANVAEIIRFKGAYACELSKLTIDGGLPFTPTGAETNGVDTVLTLDQTAHFTSYNLNLVNYRYRGIQAIHVWESYFEETRIFNGGFFGSGGFPSAGIAFDNTNQEDFTFSGAESNQIKFNKIAFGCVGTLVKMTAPCFNVVFDFVVAEGRTWPVTYTALGESKWIVDGVSQGIVVDQCWHYAHDQIANTQATCFSLVNAGQNVRFLSYRIYQEIPTGNGNFLEMPNIINNTSAYPIDVDLSIEDLGDAVTTLWNGVSAGSLITGRIDYRNDKARTINDFMGATGITAFSGEVTFLSGAFTTDKPEVYDWKANKRVVSQIEGSGVFEEFSCRAIANFNGSTGVARKEKGITVTKTGTGTYTATFDQAMPTADYVVNLSIQKANLGDIVEIGGQGINDFSVVVRTAGGVFHDAPILCISVFL